VIVRAQIMTQLYGAFLWLRDSLMTPVGSALPGTTTAAIVQFLCTDDRRRLRNSVAHGRWRYLPDFSGLECWDGRPPTVFTITSADLGAWQLVSRASTTAVLLALTSDYELRSSISGKICRDQQLDRSHSGQPQMSDKKSSGAFVLVDGLKLSGVARYWR
jgi:hypothetical protein